MNKTSYRFATLRHAKLSSIVLATLVLPAASSCVQTRASRNGVFNENQYLRKDFLIRNAGTTTQDPGWIGKATFTQVSTPNPLGSSYFGITPGIDSGAQLFRWVVTEDKLQMVSTRNIQNDTTDPNVTSAVVNAWSATNVDLKYQVNLDGEVTNFYQENQEAPWQDREWVKLNFAKNDLSDVAPFGTLLQDALNTCTDVGESSATLVPGSFYYTSDPSNPQNDYLQFGISVTVPLSYSNTNCGNSYGTLGNEAQILGHTSATFNILYSMVRAKALDDPNQTYQPNVVAEKDPIRHKYGFFQTDTLTIDPNTQLPTSQSFVNRFDPNKPIVWYYSQGFKTGMAQVLGQDPSYIFEGPNGIAAQTNAILEGAGVKARVSFVDYDAQLAPGQPPREYGDIRYNFLVWLSDQDTESDFIGVTPSVNDPRTGETISASLTLSQFSFQDKFLQRIDAFLQSIGASAGIDTAGEWPATPAGVSGTCQDGDTAPIVDATLQAVHNGQSSVYQYMQLYLNKPQAQYGSLGPADFIVQQDDDFYHAFYALLPYQIFADPASNFYTTPEGQGGVFGPTSASMSIGTPGSGTLVDLESQFQALSASIDQGVAPYNTLSPTASGDAIAFLNNMKALTLAHKQYNYQLTFAKNNGWGMKEDTSDILSLEEVADAAARHCINGVWETKEQWVQNITNTFWSQVSFHEFGHAMGMTHNFMGSVDRPHFPTYQDNATPPRTHYGNYTSSVMEYNSSIADVDWHMGWGPYDQGCIGWIYGNNSSSYNGTPALAAISGQNSPTSPWNDPFGFNSDGTEKAFLMCNEYHEKYTPFCRTYDLGSSPSEITANQLDAYEWQYQWRNFRTYHKIWDDSAYANTPAALFTDMRKFLSLWVFDWSSGEIADTLVRIGINANNSPDPQYNNTPAIDYLNQLTNKFNADISASGQMVSAYTLAMVEQSAGQRPYRTIYDPYYGDVEQQGIILDKLYATQGFVGLWPTDNYDQNQAGSYIASYEGIGDTSYDDVAEYAVTAMIGGNYDAFPYFPPLAVAQFAQDTHSPNFGGRYDVRDWIGGFTFTRIQDFLSYFQNIAVQNNYVSPDGSVNCSNTGAKALCTAESCLNNAAGGFCAYDPTKLSDFDNGFVGPDNRRWIWSYIADRNEWVALEQDRNVASYVIAQTYNDDIVNQADDGSFPGGAYPDELPMKYFLDYYQQYN